MDLVGCDDTRSTPVECIPQVANDVLDQDFVVFGSCILWGVRSVVLERIDYQVSHRDPN